MSNDYTLPPVPSLRLYQRGYERFDMEDYGHACAEHVRAPLLARIAELEAENSALAESIALGPGVSEVKSASQEIDRLRAEVEALTAANAALLADAERWRQHKKDRPVLLVTGYFGDGRMNRSVCDVEALLDAAIAARKGEGSEG